MLFSKYIIVYLFYNCLTKHRHKITKKGLTKLFIYMGKLSTPKNQKRIDEKLDFIDQWLPARYTSSVNMILKKDKRNPAYIRHVKNAKTNDEKIIDALYKVAQLNKLQVGS